MKLNPDLRNVPALAEALDAAPAVKKIFAAMPPSHQRQYGEWVGGAKKPATQNTRAKKALGMIEAWARKK